MGARRGLHACHRGRPQRLGPRRRDLWLEATHADFCEGSTLMSGGSKGGSSNTNSQSYSSQSGSVQLPDWLNSASQQAVSSAQNLLSNNYAPQYTGEMVAGPSDLTNQYYGAVQ